MVSLLLNESLRIHQPHLEGEPMKYTPHPPAAFRRFKLLVLMTAPYVMAACCGGSGDAGISADASIRALRLPDRIVSTNDNRQTADGRFALAAGRHPAANGNADTDALDMLNAVLGVVKVSGYADYVNQGPYMALVRQVNEGRQDPAGGNATASPAGQFLAVHVEVTRASNSSPMIVKVRVEDKEGIGEGPMLIRGCFSVTQGVSAAYPCGIMFARLQGTVLDSDGNEGADLFAMAVSVGLGGGSVVAENNGVPKGGEAYEFHHRMRVDAEVGVPEGDADVQEADGAGLQLLAALPI
jgi:hypothetical protein